MTARVNRNVCAISNSSNNRKSGGSSRTAAIIEIVEIGIAMVISSAVGSRSNSNVLSVTVKLNSSVRTMLSSDRESWSSNDAMPSCVFSKGILIV